MPEAKIDSVTDIKGEVGGSVSLGRHAAQCTVCRHPPRQEIEEDWIAWASPAQIAYDYSVNRYSIYRHAHALDLSRKISGWLSSG